MLGITKKNTIELHLSEHWLSGPPNIWIGLALWINLSRIYKCSLSWNYRLSDQVRDTVTASRTSNRAWL